MHLQKRPLYRLVRWALAAALGAGGIVAESGMASATISCTFVSTWGSQGAGNGEFNQPWGVAVGASGDVYVTDLVNNRVEKFDAAGSFLTAWTVTGPGGHPRGIGTDAGGNVYVVRDSDEPLDTSIVSKFDAGGSLLTAWGSGGSGNGQFDNPYAVAADGSGNVYIADTTNNRIQQLDSTGTFLNAWGVAGAGNGQFAGAAGVAIDGSGDVYVADSLNNRIQKFDASGTFLTTWGTLGAGNGQFNTVDGVAADGIGNVYVADTVNCRIQVFDESGTFLTTFGTLGMGTGEFAYPTSVAADGIGNVYVADFGNQRIQKWSCLSSICGNGVVEPGEQCDDSGTVGGDGCDLACQLEPRVVSQTAGPGGTVTTDTGATGATPSQPVQAAVTTPTGGTVTISTGPATAVPPPGFTALGGLVQITAPVETAANPLVIVFELDASIIPLGQDETTIQIYKNGVAVAACTGAPGIASPDPCVSDRVLLPGGDVVITVLSSTASAWSGIVDVCGDTPQNGCRPPASRKASLLLRGAAAGAAKAALKWQWAKGAAATAGDFGAPVTATDYTLCVYDQGGAGSTSRLRLKVVAAHGGTCAGKPCWKGFKYANKTLIPDGLKQIGLKTGEVGKAKITVQGKGANLSVSPLPLTMPVRVQLRRSDSSLCWEARYGTASQNDGIQFKAKSD